MIPETHAGVWVGPNRLWFEAGGPERSEGRLVAAPTLVEYTWSFRGAPQEGRLAVSGPPTCLRVEWRDTWHAADGFTLHGQVAEGRLSSRTTYTAGEGPAWGWRIELDLADPEHLTLRMFNVLPSGEEAIAVDLRGARAP